MDKTLATWSATGGSPISVDTNGICLLSFDGGGVRGLSSLMLLKSIMDWLNQDRVESGKNKLKPCEIFDLIGGTSTGGLIAIMLGRLEMDVDECISVYINLMASVFEDKKHKTRFGFSGNVRSMYDSNNLKAAIEEAIKGTGKYSPDESFNDGVERGCKVFVCALAKETSDIVRLRSYSLKRETNIEATICEAALATSAASGYFSKVTIGSRTFIDAALGSNNPVDQVANEASNIYCPDTGDLKPWVKCFVSIGTGNPGKHAIHDSARKFLMKDLPKLVTETEKTAQSFIAQWRGHYDAKRYFRFNVHHGLEHVGLAEYKERGTIEAATTGYLDEQEQKFALGYCVKNLAMKENLANPDLFVSCQINSARVYHAASLTGQSYPIHAKKLIKSYVPRLKLLGKLKEQFDRETTEECANEAKIVGIWGMGGAGKSQLALSYVQKYRGEYESVYWIDATDEQSIASDFVSIFNSRAGSPSLDGQLISPQNVVDRVISWFMHGKGPWIFVLEAADTLDYLERYIPNTPKAHVIILSRVSSVQRLSTFEGLQVNDLEEDEAIEIFFKCAQISGRTQDQIVMAKPIVRDLGYSPLAITLAGSYIAQRPGLQSNLSEFHIELEKRPDVLRGYTETVTKTLEMSFSSIESETCQLLSLLSMFSGEDMFLHLLLDKLLKDKETSTSWSFLINDSGVDIEMLQGCFAKLEEYSFITRSESGEGYYSMHPLVQIWANARIGSKTEHSRQYWVAGAQLLKHMMVYLQTNIRTGDIKLRLLAHLRHYSTKLLAAKDVISEPILKTIEEFARFASYIGRFTEAASIQKEVLEMRRYFQGENHTDIIISTSALAVFLREQSNFEEAEEMLRVVVKNLKKEKGYQHPDTILAVERLATTLRMKGRLEEAEEMHDEVLKLRCKVLPDHHEDTIAAMNSLAATRQRRGKVEEAIKMFKKVVQSRAETLGEQDPETLKAKVNLATSMHSRGDCAEAVGMFEEILNSMTLQLGDEHPDTIRVSRNLASALKTQGKLDQALKIRKEVLNKRQRILGEMHTETIRAWHDLSGVLSKQGEVSKAMDIQRDVLSKRSLILGSRHPDTIATMNLISSTLKRQGKLNEAKEMQNQIIELSEKQFDQDSPNVLASKAKLGRMLRTQGNLDDSEKILRHVLDQRLKTLGEMHPYTISSLDSLALTISDQAMIAGGVEAKERGLPLASEPDTIETLNASNLPPMRPEGQKKLREAENMHREVLIKRRFLLGNESPPTFEAMGHLANTLKRQNKLTEAEELQREVVEKRLAVLDDTHQGILVAMSRLAIILAQQNKFLEAVKWQRKVLEKREIMFHCKDLQVLRAKYDLASMVRQQGNLEEAEALSRDVLDTRRTVVGKNHLDTIEAMELLAKVLLDQAEAYKQNII